MIFIKNKYTKTYYNIISNAQSQNRIKSKSKYFENHHIIPSSLDGLDHSNNLILLTPREHYIVHLLLTKMVEGNAKHKMMFALSMLSNIKNIGEGRYTPSSKLYEYARLGYVKAMDNYWTPERRSERAKLTSKNVKGRKASEETKEKHRNKVWTEKAIQNRLENCLKAANSRKDKPWSASRRKAHIDGYIKRNANIAKHVIQLHNLKYNNSEISRKLNISWEKVKYLLNYKDEFISYHNFNN